MLEASASRMQLLVALGRIPRDLRAVDEREQMRHPMDRWTELLEKHAIPAEIVTEFIEIIEETLGPRPPERHLRALASS